jgi:hypothetical protein
MPIGEEIGNCKILIESKEKSFSKISLKAILARDGKKSKVTWAGMSLKRMHSPQLEGKKA